MTFLAAAGASPLIASGCTRTGDKLEQERKSNALLWAVAWKQTAAEYRALCYQAYNLARLRLDLALARRSGNGKPLAVITDMDDTILHADSYWGHLIEIGREFFDDAIWDQWLPKNLHTLVPGALEFFDYCAENAVEVFYVTSRNQGDRTYEYALAQLRESGFPYADESHLTVYRDSSDKSPAREAIGQTHDIVLLLGDNLNDYKRDYYVNGVDERAAVMERDRADFGDIFILLPNPTDGHWVRAIFGESEPVPSNAAYKALFAAATRRAWDGN
ncbi:MAG: acid phosphatase [Gammaproteobacteria bacterium]|nr:acid phosphatase [Gammaproteobacteria bacterium]